MKIEKAGIPRGYSFVIRSSQLEQAMRNAGISTDTRLRYMRSKTFFRVLFWPPRPAVQYERFYIQTGCVPSAQAREMRLFMETQVLPAFIAWAAGILALPPNSPIRWSNQEFHRSPPSGGSG